MGDYSIIMQYRDIVLGHSHLSRLLITQRFLHFSRNDDTG